MSTCFTFWGCVEQEAGFTVPKCRVDQSKSTVSIQEKVGSTFCVTLYVVQQHRVWAPG